jgi:hypothetical protein
VNDSDTSPPISPEQGSTPEASPAAAERNWYSRNRTLAAIVVAVIVFAAVAAVVWFLRSDDSSSTGNPTVAPGSATTPTGSGAVTGIAARIVSLAELRAFAGRAGHPVFWAGPRVGTRIEFTQTTDGSTYVRYLTGSAKAGTKRARYIVVATYPQPDAYARATKSARSSNFKMSTLADGTVAITRPIRPQNVNLVTPGKPYQVEVFAATPAETQALVFGGAITPVP